MLCGRCVGVCLPHVRLMALPRWAAHALQEGKTPCFISAEKGNDKCLAMLIEAGCDVNTPDKARAGRE